MDTKIILTEEKIVKNNIQKMISELYKSNNISKRPYFNICFTNNNNEKEYIYFQDDYVFTLFINLNIEESFKYFIKEFIPEKSLDIKLSFELLQIADKLELSEKCFFEIFSLMKWQTFKKGLDYFNALKTFSNSLRNRVLTKKLSINEAYLFHNQFKNDYDDFIDKLPLHFSFSQNNQIFQYIVEISKKNNKKLNEIIVLCDFKDEITLFESLFRLKYPEYSKILNKFNNFIGSFGFPKNTNIDFDKTFEKTDYKFEIKFSNVIQLKDKLKKTIESIEKNQDKDNFIDYFDQKELLK
jgi:hypothetical protein